MSILLNQKALIIPVELNETSDLIGGWPKKFGPHYHPMIGTTETGELYNHIRAQSCGHPLEMEAYWESSRTHLRLFCRQCGFSINPDNDNSLTSNGFSDDKDFYRDLRVWLVASQADPKYAPLLNDLVCFDADLHKNISLLDTRIKRKGIPILLGLIPNAALLPFAFNMALWMLRDYRIVAGEANDKQKEIFGF